MVANTFAETVAQTILKQLEKGLAPWTRPWEPGERFLPYNPTTGNTYKGINSLWLLGVAEDKGFSDNRWMTYKQADSLNGQVNKGEKGTLIQFWQWQDQVLKTDDMDKPVHDEDGHPLKITVQLQKPKVRSAVVFNAEQITGLPEATRSLPEEWERHETAERILADSGAVIQHEAGNKALYSPSKDLIILPKRGQFKTPDAYYATALHELAHWSGHESRLKRDIKHPFGSQAYAREELRAEIASMLMGERFGIGHDPSQHVAYIGSWIQILTDEPKELFKASRDAQLIVDYCEQLSQTKQMAAEAEWIRESQEKAQMDDQHPNVGIEIRADWAGDATSDRSPDSTPQEFTDEPPLQIQVPILREPMSMTTPERLYLDVPYLEKEEAKALGAKWDRDEKAWYAPSAEPELLERWSRNRSDVVLNTAPDPQAEFASAIRLAGLIIDSSPVMDGELRRVQVQGDKYGDRSGAYLGHLDGHPSGFIQNHKTGLKTNWKASQKTAVLSAKDRARLEAEAAEKQKMRAQAREAIAEQTAEAVAAHWMAGDLANEHIYLENKGVQAHGLRVNTLGPLTLAAGRTDAAPQQWSNKDELLIPVYGPDGQLWAAQSIDGQGRKSFPRGSRLHGGHFILGQAHEEDVLFLAEGYATAATIHELTGKPVVVAFYSGNLSAVAEAIREQHPEKVIVIAGDDDHQKPFEKNVGRRKAEEAAQKVEGYTLFPPFEKSASGTDWNDFMKENGKEQTAFLLERAIGRAKALWEVTREAKESGKARCQEAGRVPSGAEQKPELIQTAGRSLSR